MERRRFLEMLSVAGMTEMWGAPFSPSIQADPSLGMVVDSVRELVSMHPSDSSEGAVSFTRGYHVPGDGGGGIFVWDPDHSEAPNQVTVVGRPEQGGRWKRLHDGTLPLEAFGARSIDASPPGGGDRVRSVSEALALASTLSEVQTIRCLGEYRIDQPVVLDGALTIRNGDFTVRETCFTTGENLPAAFVVQGSGVRFEDVRVKGPDARVEGPVLVIHVRRGAQSFSFRSSHISRFHSVSRPGGTGNEAGISMTIGILISHTGCRNFEVKDSEISNLSAAGNGTVGDSHGVCTGVLVGNSRGTFDSGNPTRGEIRGCRFQDLQPLEDADAIKTQLVEGERGLQTHIEGCTFVDCAKRGVKCQAPDTRVLGNTFRAESLVVRSAVSVYSHDCTVRDNRISGKFNFGIEINADHFVVDSNRIVCEASRAEIGYRDSSGIWLRSGENGSVTKNSIQGFLQSVTIKPFEQRRLGHVEISYNTFEAAIGNAVSCWEPGAESKLEWITFSNNQTVNPGKYALLVLDATNGPGKYKLRLLNESIEKKGGREATQSDSGVLMVEGVHRLTAQNLLIQADNFTDVLTANGCEKVTMSHCLVEGKGRNRRLVNSIDSRTVLVKENVIPRDMVVVDSGSTDSQGITQMRNHVW